jgi:hypothetical protein
VNDERLTDRLAEGVMGWRLAPGRYLKSGRGWISRPKFRPLHDVRDAFRLVYTMAADYSLTRKQGGGCTAIVRSADQTGTVTAASEARAISLAVAAAIGLETESSAGAKCAT